MGFKPRENYRVTWWPKSFVRGGMSPGPFLSKDFRTKKEGEELVARLKERNFHFSFSRLSPYKTYTPLVLDITEIDN